MPSSAFNTHPPSNAQPGRAETRRLVNAQKVRMLYQQTPVALIASLPAVLLIYWGVAGHGFFVDLWLAIMTLAISLRLLLTLMFFRRSPKQGDLVVWHRLYILSVLALGVAWSAVPWMPDDGIPDTRLLVFAAAVGVAAAGIGTMGSSLTAYVAFLAPIAASTMARAFTLDSKAGIITGALVLLFALTLALATRRMNHYLDESLFLNLEKSHLISTLEASKKEAERANQAKSEFLSRMSHELRTPMNAILGFAQVLESDPDEPLSESQSESVTEILTAGDHLLNLINEVLDLSRIEAGGIEIELEPVELGPVMEECVSLVRPIAADYQVNLLPMLAADAIVMADRRYLKQVLINLLSNAIKYNRPGGEVELIAELSADNRVRVTVHDTGLGLTEQQQALVFEPFNRVAEHKHNIEGTGIGLTISRKLISAMGGEIGVQSQKGSGSRFWIDLGDASTIAAIPR